MRQIVPWIDSLNVIVGASQACSRHALAIPYPGRHVPQCAIPYPSTGWASPLAATLAIPYPNNPDTQLHPAS